MSVHVSIVKGLGFPVLAADDPRCEASPRDLSALIRLAPMLPTPV
jgi:hypothetical protein